MPPRLQLIAWLVLLVSSAGITTIDDAVAPQSPFDIEQMKWFRGELERTRTAEHVFVLGPSP